MVFNAANGNPYTCGMLITTFPDGSEDVIINQPVVSSQAKNGFAYSGVVFHPGDLVTITADGCVQTAGHGLTWKKYVNPTGDESGANNDNGLYYGSITVNGGISAHAPVQDLALENLGVAKSSAGGTIYIQPVQSIPGRPNTQVLILGYRDDNYDDYGGNGYWGHDSGNDNQCANAALNAPYGKYGGPAWIKFHIVHNAKNPFVNEVAKQWDLVPHGLDLNGLYFNPEWGWQVNGGKIDQDGVWDPSCLPNCSSQHPTFDSAEATASNWFNRFFANVCNWDHGASGHHNWFDVTYQGQVTWVEHAGDAFHDDDYNMTLNSPIFHYDPPGQTIVGWGAGTSYGNNTADNAPAEAAIGLEFDSDETIDHYDQNVFWHNLHQAVDGNTDNPYGSDAAAGAMIDHHDAVVIGLMGFDEMHGTYTEIHPVHALAIREGSQVYSGNTLDPSHDRWAFFVRNWGDEGECSRFQHYLQADQITLQIPAPKLKGVNQPTFTTATLNQNNTQVLGTGTDGVAHFYSGPEGTFVTFNLSSAASQPFAFGEFELNWDPATGRKPGTHREVEAQNKPEERLEAIWEGATPDQQRLYQMLFASLYQPRPAIMSSPLRVEVQDVTPRRPEKMPAVTVAPATEKLRRDAAQFQALCAATAGKLSTQPTWCPSARVPPVTILTTSGGTLGENGLYTPVTATLTVYDASGSGIAKTDYSFDGENWKTYSGPFVLPAGAYTLYHRSQDKAGNQEELQQRVLQVRTSVASMTSPRL